MVNRHKNRLNSLEIGTLSLSPSLPNGVQVGWLLQEKASRFQDLACFRHSVMLTDI